MSNETNVSINVIEKYFLWVWIYDGGKPSFVEIPIKTKGHFYNLLNTKTQRVVKDFVSQAIWEKRIEVYNATVEALKKSINSGGEIGKKSAKLPEKPKRVIFSKLCITSIDFKIRASFEPFRLKDWQKNMSLCDEKEVFCRSKKFELVGNCSRVGDQIEEI
jgi:hypothetical protein